MTLDIKFVTPETVDFFYFVFDGEGGFLETDEVLDAGNSAVTSSTLTVENDVVNVSSIDLRVTPRTSRTVKIGGAISAKISGFTVGEHTAVADILTDTGRAKSLTMYFICVEKLPISEARKTALINEFLKLCPTN